MLCSAVLCCACRACCACRGRPHCTIGASCHRSIGCLCSRPPPGALRQHDGAPRGIRRVPQHARDTTVYVCVQQILPWVLCRSRRLLRSGKGPPAPDRHKNLIALVGEGRHWQRRRSCATCKGLGLCKMSTRSPSSRGGAQIQPGRLLTVCIPEALETPFAAARLVHSIPPPAPPQRLYTC